MRVVKFLLIITTLCCSCNNINHYPQNAENPKVEGWVFRNCVDDTYKSSIMAGFIKKVYNNDIRIDGLAGENIQHIIETFRCISPDPSMKLEDFQEEMAHRIDEIIEHWKEGETYFRWYKKSWYPDEKHVRIIANYPDLVKKKINLLCAPYYAEYDRIAQQEFSVINWVDDGGMQGDTYSGYLIEYEVGNWYFVLLRLIEFDDGRIWYRIIYKGTSLEDLKESYQ